MTATQPRTIVGGDVASIKHVGTSRGGNPTYRITLTDGRSFLTEPDGACAYSARNYEPHSLNMPVSPVLLTLNGRGRITDMTRPDGTRA